MNRCLPKFSVPFRSAWRILALALAFGAAPPSIAQTADPQRIPPIAAKAVRGVLRVTTPPEALVDGKPARLAPGARIRDRNNLMVVSGALMDQDLVVRYTRDSLGLVFEVWILTAAEAAEGQPTPPTVQSY